MPKTLQVAFSAISSVRAFNTYQIVLILDDPVFYNHLILLHLIKATEFMV